MNKQLLPLVAAVAAGLVVAAGVGAADEVTVTATATAQNVSVSVSDGTVAYGTVSLGSTASTTSSGTDDSQTASNNGNVSEDLDIKGSNSSAWTLAGSAGSEQYAHFFCTATCDASPTWTALTTNYQALATGVAASGNQVFDLRIDMPTATADYTQQSVNVLVLASAA